ncbi:MAG: sulfatase-like hydrolase/transferase [bacterium]
MNISLFTITCVVLPCWLIAHAQPNVIVMLADDAGWGDYHSSGNMNVETPQIDSIAKNGVSFENFYVCSVCSPTRAEFLTGRYYLRTGVHGVSLGAERLNLDERTIADSFKAAGYATGAFGKWHNGSQYPYHPRARGFDEFYGYTAGHWGEYIDPPLERNGRMERAKGYIVDACTDEAIRFIKKNKDAPFFCYVPFTTPHSPWAVPESYWTRFKDKALKQQRPGGDETLDFTRCALAMVENQDWNVGRILKTLEELNISDKTIVVYFSDNGPNSGRWNGGMKGRKGSVDEGGLRSVCYLRWPSNVKSGQSVNTICGAIDLMPTLLSLAEVKRVGDKPLDGLDVSPLMRGETVKWNDRMIFSVWGKQSSVRTQQYRGNAKELYDIQADRGQTKNVAGEQSAAANKLAIALNNWKLSLPDLTDDAKKNGTVDPRKIDIGYNVFPVTMLPARDGEPSGGITRSSSAPNCSYFINWTSPQDKVVWNVDVQQEGDYEVTIDYTCPASDLGSIVELSLNEASLKAKITEAWNPPLYTNQDTVPRPKAESHMKPFKNMKLANMHLKKGRGELTIRALEVPGETVMDLRRLTITLIKKETR